MSIASRLRQQLRIPVLCSPMFIVSSKELVAAQCKAGVIGSFPSLNARPESELEHWLEYICGEIDAWNRTQPPWPAAPYAVNLIVHPSNPRLVYDLDLICRHKVPMVITSLNQPGDVVEKVHQYGGLVFHDVSTVRHARKAAAAGVDGLILVCAGAGGHTGAISPLAFVSEVREFFDGPIVMSGSVSNGRHVLAALAMGADFAYIGTRFIAATEGNANPAYKQMVLDSAAADVVCTSAVTGIPANYLTKSFDAIGLDPYSLPARETKSFSFGKRGDGTEAKAWKDIWSAGHGVGTIHAIQDTREIVDQMAREYFEALGALKRLDAA
jgi:nitronate monooxygenase